MSAEDEMVHRIGWMGSGESARVIGGESFFFSLSLSVERNGALFLLSEAWMMIGMTDDGSGVSDSLCSKPS